jgi:hypothetical protein
MSTYSKWPCLGPEGIESTFLLQLPMRQHIQHGSVLAPNAEWSESVNLTLLLLLRMRPHIYKSDVLVPCTDWPETVES